MNYKFINVFLITIPIILATISIITEIIKLLQLGLPMEKTCI
jgi:hypothetical protein